MTLAWTDLLVLIVFYALVVGVSLWKSRRERKAEEYFLAGRGLTWPLIGLSIVAANISTEQLVGMAGQSAGSVGLAVSAWQLTGSGAWTSDTLMTQASSSYEVGGLSAFGQYEFSILVVDTAGVAGPAGSPVGFGSVEVL